MSIIREIKMLHLIKYVTFNIYVYIYLRKRRKKASDTICTPRGSVRTVKPVADPLRATVDAR
jgi:hypothetical protein